MTTTSHAFDTAAAGDHCPFMPVFGPPQVMFARGRGTELWDVNGKRYLDFLCGLAVTSLGHSSPVVTDAICGQSATTTFTTMSASAGLEQMRSQLDDGSAYDAAGIPAGERGLDFVRPDGTRTVFQAANAARIRRYDDTGKALA